LPYSIFAALLTGPCRLVRFSATLVWPGQKTALSLQPTIIADLPKYELAYDADSELPNSDDPQLVIAYHLKTAP